MWRDFSWRWCGLKGQVMPLGLSLISWVVFLNVNGRNQSNQFPSSISKVWRAISFKTPPKVHTTCPVTRHPPPKPTHTAHHLSSHPAPPPSGHCARPSPLPRGELWSGCIAVSRFIGCHCPELKNSLQKTVKLMPGDPQSF